MELFSDQPELNYAQAEVRQLGQVFTPYAIAKFMASWVVDNSCCQTILDPAVGLGILLRAILSSLHQTNQQHPHQLIGYDIDLTILHQARQLLAGLPQIELHQGDYLQEDWQRQYPGIICNPPYQRFHNYPNRPELLALASAELGIKLSGLTSLHTLFLLKSVHQLSVGGRAAYILPAEFLNANYGVAVKDYLLRSHSLRHVIVFNFHHQVFAKAITTACILLLAKDGCDRNVEFVSVQSLEELPLLNQKLQKSQQSVESSPLTPPRPQVKWRVYYQNLQLPQGPLVPLSAYGRVSRGIATGDNGFFTFNQSKQRQWAIAPEFFLPCITKANQVKNHFFGNTDWQNLHRQDKPVWLLKADDQNPAVRAYLDWGVSLGVDQRYLTRHRNPWFALEKRAAAPILIAVFQRGQLKFVCNEAGVNNLTCFHCFYPHQPEQTELLMAYFLSTIAQEIFQQNRREYGSGLIKFEPNDLNNSPILDLGMLQPAQISEILGLYHLYRDRISKQQPGDSVIQELNLTFTEFFKLS